MGDVFVDIYYTIYKEGIAQLAGTMSRRLLLPLLQDILEYSGHPLFIQLPSIHS